jgi:ABC-type multidrug transport system ATPase subunit
MYLFATGSTIKMPGGKPVYYSDVVANFMADGGGIKLSFNADKVSFKFPNGAVGLRDINISEGSGKLIGLMGASGAGKTTLLNVLSGIENVSEGQVLINGINIHKEKDKIKGLIGIKNN